MKIKELKLEETPEKFQTAVNKQIVDNAKYHPKLLVIKAYKNTPYIDKSIVSTIYKAYLEIFNALVVVGHEEISKPEWNNREPWTSELILGDIDIFVRYSETARNVCKEAIKEIKSSYGG